MSTDLTFNQALEFHKHSKLIEAKELYEKFLQNNSEHSDALHLLGTVSYSLGDYDKACILVKKALSIEPHEFYYNVVGETNFGNFVDNQVLLLDFFHC